MDERYFMKRAISISRGMMHGLEGGPFGAVVVKDGEIVAEGHNQVTTANDPTAHAEVVAIREACRALGTFNLEGCEIYASCEPCPMCLSAIYWARLGRIYYANSRLDAAGIGFDDEHIYVEVAKPIEDREIPTIRLMAEEALGVFEEWDTMPGKVRY
ncbi:MAG: nucleoside deaminase [Rhodospirillales bacterium]|jgi:tRNA(Arg) A34 adenosine deaminase TadA|nr:nucleoside deaminase [Rhodospirillales bacterium]HJO72490.1 nucleoside deaminase [Rhodospirillales bacterium]